MYFKRKAEVQKRVKDARSQMSMPELSVKDQEEFKNAEAALETYFNSRQKILEDALLFLSDESKTVEQQRIRWENHMNARSSEALRVLIEFLKYKKESLLVTVISEIMSQESIFFMKLSNMQLSSVMFAQLLEYRKQFEIEKKNLKDKWEELKNENLKLNGDIEAASAKILEVYKEALGKAGTYKDTIRNNLKLFFTGLTAVGKVTGTVKMPPGFKEAVSLFSASLKAVMPSSKELSGRLDRLYRSEESVTVIMFGNTRKCVKEFLEKTNLDKAQKDYYEAHKHAQQVAANMLTDGQKEDAAIFVRIAEEITRKTLTSFTDAYNGFVNDFKEIFIGPVGDRTVKDLIKKDRWDWAKDEWRRMNVQAELKKIYDDNRDWIDVDVFDITPEVKDQIKAALKEERERLDLALSEAGDRSILETLGLFLTIQKESIESKIKST